MSEDKAELNLKHLIIRPTLFNTIYGTLGAFIAFLVSFVLPLNAARLQHLWLTIAIPPAALLVTEMILKFSVFEQDFELKQNQQISAKNLLVLYNIILILGIVALGAAMIEFNIHLPLKLKECLFGYVFVWMSSSLMTMIDYLR